MYNLCVFTCIIVIFVFHRYTCASVICIKLLLTYLLTYLMKHSQLNLYRTAVIGS